MPEHDQLELFREIIRKRTGVFIPKKKDYLLDARLQKMLRASGLTNMSNLLATLQSDPELLQELLIQFSTTNHTFFFREAEHFTLLIEDIRRHSRRKYIIWIAASSTGEEVWSTAIILREAGIINFLILASDINIENLKYLKQGLYPVSRFREMPTTLLEKYFDPLPSSDGDEGNKQYRVKQILHPHVVCRTINLLDPLQLVEAVPYIFCRNVLMYFDKETQRRVLNHLTNNLSQDGLLFIGQSESLLGLNCPLVNVAPSVYRKKENHG